MFDDQATGQDGRARPAGRFLHTDPAEKADAQDLLDELKELTTTLGIPVIESRLVFPPGNAGALPDRLRQGRGNLRSGRGDRPPT